MKSTFLFKKKHLRRKGNFDLTVEYFLFYMRGNNFIIFKYYSEFINTQSLDSSLSWRDPMLCL